MIILLSEVPKYDPKHGHPFFLEGNQLGWKKPSDFRLLTTIFVIIENYMVIDRLQSTPSWLIFQNMAIRKHLFLISDPTEPQILKLTSTMR